MADTLHHRRLQFSVVLAALGQGKDFRQKKLVHIYIENTTNLDQRLVTGPESSALDAVNCLLGQLGTFCQLELGSRPLHNARHVVYLAADLRAWVVPREFSSAREGLPVAVERDDFPRRFLTGKRTDSQ